MDRRGQSPLRNGEPLAGRVVREAPCRGMAGGRADQSLERAPAGEGEPHASLTVHALNVVTGIPAAGLVVRFMELEDPKKSWIELMNSTTNVDGRLDKSSLTSLRLKAGTYKLRFETGEYWQQQGHHSFYPYVEVVFTITEEEQKVHIPLLMSPYSYTTYRGN
nr:5-hydroxyisourate hydrolase-like isoform X2 [Anolis sagrei ordinatus]